MKRILAGLVALSMLAGTTVGAVAAPNGSYTAQQNRYNNDNRGGYDNNRYDNRGNDRSYRRYDQRGHYWRRGERIDRNDWNRGQRIDYRVYRLSRPHRGYEWREVNGQFIEAAIVGGLIVAVIASSR